MILVQAAKLIGAGIKVSVISGVGIGTVFGALINAVARNPGLTNQLFSYAILGFALTEVIALFVLMMSFLILGSFFNLTWLGTDSITCLAFFVWSGRTLGTPTCEYAQPQYILGAPIFDQYFWSYQFSPCLNDQALFSAHKVLFYGRESPQVEDAYLSIIDSLNILKTNCCGSCTLPDCKKKPTGFV